MTGWCDLRWALKHWCSSTVPSCVFVSLGTRGLFTSTFICRVGHPWAKQIQAEQTMHIVLDIHSIGKILTSNKTGNPMS